MPLPPSLQFTQALYDAQSTLRWSLADWDLAIRQARRLRLLARIAERLQAEGLLEQQPVPVQRHLRAEIYVSRWRLQALRWAIERVGDTLRPLRAPRVLLKGAAYVVQDLPNALGRLPSDLDILVPAWAFGEAQLLLERGGWKEVELNQHDRRYYLEWSHELPPMRHPVLTLELDVHHNILPVTRRTRVDPELLLAEVQPSSAVPWSVLKPQDQVLHCAAHLILDAEPRERVRDLLDLDALLRWFGNTTHFWTDLRDRAEALTLYEPLALALGICAEWFDTPLPADLHAWSTAPRNGRSLLGSLMKRTILPGPPGKPSPRLQALCASILWWRYQFDRLPVPVLAAHAWRRLHSRLSQADAG